MPNLTKHGKKRITERVGINQGDAKRNATRAYRRGIQLDETTGALKSWMTGRYYRHRKHPEMRIFRGFLYIYRNGVLITVYPIPEDLQNSFENYVQPGPYKKYEEYLNCKACEKASREYVKKSEKYREKRRIFINRVLLEDVRQFTEGRFDVSISCVCARECEVVVRYVPTKKDVPDLCEVADYLKECTVYTEVRFVHERDRYGRLIFPERYRIDPDEDELVYHSE
jgi:hypothetical protein